MEYSATEIEDVRTFLVYLESKHKIDLSETLYQMLFISVNGLRGSSINGKYVYELYKDYPYYCCIYQQWKSTFSTLSNPDLGKKNVSLNIGNLKFPLPSAHLSEGQNLFEVIDGQKIFEPISWY